MGDFQDPRQRFVFLTVLFIARWRVPLLLTTGGLLVVLGGWLWQHLRWVP